MSDLLSSANRPLPTRIPRAALLPGLLGLTPFWALALSTLAGTGIDPLLALTALIMYGAIILSFVGALWWGLAIHAPANAPRDTLFVWSVIPALIGWFATLALPDVGLRMLMAGLALQWVLDGMLMRKVPELIPSWMFRLRTMLTFGALGALGLAWWQLV
ncbi:DUF3429 domain-containing protein [Alcaligenaceae bacterium LF4-65]|jgi:hypothetical protein|uniref:DUF3429 domain-containing protein n=1 Tax=Zwartia hollandica TaxID=324606 RepID=A0A953N6Q9_9BURK|nr:DUF3429 domain-containing protein [Zwartia hollandica]MBZ1349937.1 DUF3429 domain-containing protein [Zwartia hollandica]